MVPVFRPYRRMSYMENPQVVVKDIAFPCPHPKELWCGPQGDGSSVETSSGILSSLAIPLELGEI